MKFSDVVKQECERIWIEGETASRIKKAKWAWYRGHLVPFVGKRYLSDYDTDLRKAEQSV